MGSLTLPSRGSIYLDASIIIYSVERNEPYFTLLAPAWQQAAAGQYCSDVMRREPRRM